MVKIVTDFFIVIGITMLVFAALQFTARRKTPLNYWLAFLFLCFGYIWLYFGLYRATRFRWAPWLLYSDVIVTFLLGPIMYAYTGCLAGESRTGARDYAAILRRWLPFLPAVIVLFVRMMVWPEQAFAAGTLAGPDPDYYAYPCIDYFNTAADTYFFVYGALSTKTILGLYRRGNEEFRDAFRGVAVYFLVGLSTFSIYLAGHLLRSDNLLALATLINGVNSTYFFFYCYRRPEYTQRAVRLRNGATAAASHGRDASTVLAGLRAFIEAGGYQDPDISLQSVSMEIGVQHYRLSQALHERMGMDFRNYINRCRIEEAKRLLAERPDMTVLRIAYSVGFNSKSAFNSSFHKLAGLSPTEYRKISAESS